MEYNGYFLQIVRADGGWRACIQRKDACPMTFQGGTFPNWISMAFPTREAAEKEASQLIDSGAFH